MRGNVMTLQPENSSVTMLRTNTDDNTAPNLQKSQAQDEGSPPSAPVENGGPEFISNKHAGMDSVNTGGLSKITRYKKPILAGFVVAACYATWTTGVQIPFLGHNTSKPVVAITPIQRNGSGITPPELGSETAIPTPQKPPQPRLNPHVLTPATQSNPLPEHGMAPPSPLTPQPDTAIAIPPPAPASETTQNTTADVHNMVDTHFDERMEHAEALNPSVVSRQQNQDGASDRLFIEMNRRLADMSNQMKELQAKLDTTQQALNDRISTGLGKIDGRLDELQHREDLIESQKRPEPTSSSQGTTPKAAPNDTRANPVATALSDHHTVKKITKDPTPAPLPHYSVQAGAPDIAILMDSSGTPLRVQPGSNIDGWGNVLAVMPAGNGWVVKTEHGIIR